MKIALDVTPLTDVSNISHRVRGVGFYIKNLKSSLLKYYPNNNYIFFTRNEVYPDNVDVVHYPYFEPFFLTLPIKKRKKIVVTVHDLIPFVFPKYFSVGIKGWLKWQIQKCSLRRVDAVITDSSSSKNDIVKYAGISERKIHVVHLAAGEEFKKIDNASLQAENIRKKYNLPGKFVLYVGDATWNKNLPRLIKAVEEIKVPLVMVGRALVEKKFDKKNSWNQDLVTIQQLAENNPMIIRLGFLPTDDLVVLYNIASVFCMPSLYEGFGLPLLEAMQCGCPVVTTKQGSIPEVAGDAVLYVNANSVDSIAEGIVRVSSDRSLQKALTKKGLNHATLFSWKRTVWDTVKVYESI